MESSRTGESRHFWSSAYAVKLIREQLGESWKPKPGQEAWQTLRDEIVTLNSRGRVKPPDAPKVVANGVESYLLLDGQPLPEKEDHRASYPDFCTHLGVLARLLQAFRRKLTNRLGKRKGMSAEKLTSRFKDLRLRTFFEIAWTVGAQDTSTGLNLLERISREGVTWSLPGGIKQGYRDRDCGVEPLVQSTRQAMRLLGRNNQAGVATSPSTKKRKIRVKPLTGFRFRLKAKKVPPITIGSNYGKLFDLLYAAYEAKEQDHDGWVPYEACVAHVWRLPDSKTSEGAPEQRSRKRPTSLDTAVNGEAPGALKKVKSELEGKLRTAFGPPSNDLEQWWIETKDGEGYRLNQAVVVWDQRRKPSNGGGGGHSSRRRNHG